MVMYKRPVLNPTVVMVSTGTGRTESGVAPDKVDRAENGVLLYISRYF